MKRQLSLNRETLRVLTSEELDKAKGGQTVPTSTSCWAGCLVTIRCWNPSTVPCIVQIKD